MQGNTLSWQDLAAEFESASKLPPRLEIELESAPAPARLAAHAAAVLADLVVGGEDVADGRLVMLFEPEYQPEWDGQIRLVGFTRADLEAELVTDALLLEVGWSWVLDSFEGRGLSPLSVSATVSRTGSQSFGDISSRPPAGAVEIRSSWTVPNDESLTEHVYAWCDLLASAGGLEPIPSGTAALRRRKA